jgi:hypothetical protein
LDPNIHRVLDGGGLDVVVLLRAVLATIVFGVPAGLVLRDTMVRMRAAKVFLGTRTRTRPR